MLLSDQYNYIASAARLTQCEALNAPSRDFDLQNMHVFEVALCLDPDIGNSDRISLSLFDDMGVGNWERKRRNYPR